MKTYEPLNVAEFSVSGGNYQPVIPFFQNLQMASNGLFSKSAQKRSFTKMNATTGGDGGNGGKEFFEFPSKRLDGTEVARLGDLVDGKKAILVVNVASE